MPHLLTPDVAPKQLFGDLSVGTIIEEAAVLKVDGKRGVAFKLGGKIKGFAFVSVHLIIHKIIKTRSSPRKMRRL